VKVTRGYGRNYLCKKGMAVPATKENIAIFDIKKTELQEKAKQVRQAAEKRAEAFNNFELTMKVNTSHGQKIYGSIHLNDIIKAFAEHDLVVEKREINTRQMPIHNVGDYDLMLQFHSDVRVHIPLHVESIESQNKRDDEDDQGDNDYQGYDDDYDDPADDATTDASIPSTEAISEHTDTQNNQKDDATDSETAT